MMVADNLSAAFIAVDWGSSNLRLYLCNQTGTILRTVASDKGLKSVANRAFAETLNTLLNEHFNDAECSTLPLFVCGMAGAKNGWLETPYASCPADAKQLADAVIALPKPFSGVLIPGVQATHQGKMTDVMRGEETQVIGAIALLNAPQTTLCLPGTHSKWVNVKGGSISEFSTFITGDLFNALPQTILQFEPHTSYDENSFIQGVKVAQDNPLGFLNQLFALRVLMLDEQLDVQYMASAVSGLLIATEILSTAHFWQKTHRVIVVGSKTLCERYQAAFDYLAIEHQSISSEQATCKGINIIRQQIQGKNNGN